MALPLHSKVVGAKKAQDSHAGLWFDRFFDRYENDWSVPKDEQGKLGWIKTVTDSTVGNAEQLQATSERQEKLIKAYGGTSLVMTTDWHFVTGLGNNHPVENGFAWHHTLGVPYLAGAAVKGMVRAWCEVWAENFDTETCRRWFGDTEQSGELIFFDAIPIKPVQLKADIMTPHYGDWYAKGDEAPKGDGSNIPADWHDPKPIPFLVVDVGQSFQFSFAKRSHSSINLQQVERDLTDALQWIGAGAKTAVGYGRMLPDESAKKARELKRDQDTSPPSHHDTASNRIGCMEFAE